MGDLERQETQQSQLLTIFFSIISTFEKKTKGRDIKIVKAGAGQIAAIQKHWLFFQRTVKLLPPGDQIPGSGFQRYRAHK